MSEIVGFIPAAGIGSRMQGFPIMKEMLPVPPVFGNSEISIMIDNAVQSLIKCNVKTVYFVVNDEKNELVHYVNKKYVYTNKIKAAFIYQNIDNSNYGVPYAIESVMDFFRGKTVIMRFPDTILYGDVNLESLLEFHKKKESKLTLGVFPTAHPERLGPVNINEDGKVIDLEDKPKNPTNYNTWNCIIWDDAFMDEVNDYIKLKKMEDDSSEVVLADIMRGFMKKNDLYAYEFENSKCIDVSSINEFEMIWKRQINEK